MARSNVAASSIKRGSGNSGGGKRIATGGQGRGGNASIKGSRATSARVDMKAATTGSNIKPSRTRGYDQGMHTGKGGKNNPGKSQL